MDHTSGLVAGVWTNGDEGHAGVSRLGRPWQIGIAVYITVLAVVAVSGNLLTFITISATKALRQQPLNTLVLNVALAGLLQSLFAFPVLAQNNYADYWLFGDRGCTFYALITFLASMAVLNLLVAIGAYRYVMTCRPEIKHHLSKTSTTVVVLLLCWLYAVVWALLPVMGWSRYTYESFGTSCTVDWRSRDLESVAFVAGLVVFCYLLHVTALSFCYYKVSPCRSRLRAMRWILCHDHLPHHTCPVRLVNSCK